MSWINFEKMRPDFFVGFDPIEKDVRRFLVLVELEDSHGIQFFCTLAKETVKSYDHLKKMIAETFDIDPDKIIGVYWYEKEEEG